MAAKESIFGSQSERELFTTINSRWADRFTVYPSLPFATLIKLGAMTLTHTEREFLLKTNVDYCTKQGRPSAVDPFRRNLIGNEREAEMTQG